MAAFQPDSFIVADVVASPNHDERKDGEPDMILLHYTGMESGQAALDRLTTASSKVSAHYVVFEDGRIVQCVPGAHRLRHALHDPAVLEHDVMRRDLAGGGCKSLERGLAAFHPVVVQQDHVRLAVLALVVIGRNDDVGDDEGIRLESGHGAGTLSDLGWSGSGGRLEEAIVPGPRWRQQILKFKGRLI